MRSASPSGRGGRTGRADRAATPGTPRRPAPGARRPSRTAPRPSRPLRDRVAEESVLDVVRRLAEEDRLVEMLPPERVDRIHGLDLADQEVGIDAVPRHLEEAHRGAEAEGTAVARQR